MMRRAGVTAGLASVAVGAAMLAPSLTEERSTTPRSRTERSTSSGRSLPIACRDGTMVFPWAAPSRAEQVKRLKEETFDLLVIGGGCVGSGVALDAATRGLKVALVDRDDFAAGTSGRSTKLIHGGVRYLENAFKNLDYGEYKLVREALAERRHMLAAAPYMARPLPIMVPLEKWWTVPYYYLGAKVYDFVAGDSGVPHSMLLSKRQALYNFPMLNPDKVAAAITYFDGQMNDCRYSLSVMLTGTQAGAVCVNYAGVEGLTRDAESREVNGAVVRDGETGETFTVSARAVVNATGPFSDSIRKMAMETEPKSDDSDDVDDDNNDDAGDRDIIVPAGGVHLVLPDHFSPANMGLIVPNTSDGRVLFFLPWEGGTLCGTTDSKTPITMLPKPSSMETDFVLRESGRYLDRRIKHSDVRAAWSGIRPLVKDPHSKDTKAISREHVVEHTAPNVVTIAGGKWTTYRRMAEDALEAVLALNDKLAVRAGPCVTAGLKLIGADRAGIVCEGKFDIVTITLREDYGYDRDVADHLTRNYGTRALQIAEIVQQGYAGRKGGLHPKRLVAKHPFLEAEVVFAVQHEFAQTAEDVIARRTRLAYVDYEAAMEALPMVVSLMAVLKGWSRTRCKEEQTRAETFLQTMRCPAE